MSIIYRLEAVNKAVLQNVRQEEDDLLFKG